LAIQGEPGEFSQGFQGAASALRCAGAHLVPRRGAL